MKHHRLGVLRKELEAMRDRAEAAMRVTRSNIEQMSLEQVQRLVHELQSHQIELRLQNEELQNAREELETARDRYSELHNFAPIGFIIFNGNGIVQEANTTICRALGV